MSRIAPIVLITIAGAILRLQALGAKCLWIDEALSYRLANFDMAEILVISRAPGSVHPPLYFCLLRLWTYVAGDSEFALRLPAALFGVASIPSAYLLLLQLLRNNDSEKSRLSAGQTQLAACLFATLMAFNPLEIFAAREVRGYTLGVALWFLGSIALVEALSRPRQLLTFILFSVAQCYTHNICILMVAAQCSFLLVRSLRGRAGQLTPVTPDGVSDLVVSRSSLVTPPFALLACGIIALAYIPWLAVAVKQAVHVNTAISISGGLTHQGIHWSAVPEETFAAVFRTHVSRWNVPLWGTAAFSASLLFLLLRGLIRGPLAWRYLSLSALLPLLAMLAFSATSMRTLYFSRYLIFPAAPCLGAIALFVAERRNWVVRSLLLWIAGNSILCCCVLNWDEIGSAAAPGMRGASRHIAEQGIESELVFTAGPFEQIKLAYYLRSRNHPRLLVADPDSAFWGRRYLRDEELVDLDSFLGLSSATIWLVSEDHSRLSLNLPIPDHWEILSSARFPQQLHWEREIRVFHIRTHRKREGRANPSGVVPE